MEDHVSNYPLAILFALVGWCLRVAWYYFHYDKDTTYFNLRAWWKIYDKFIILGFVGSIALAFLSDIIWTIIDSWVGMEGVPFDERFNIAIGFLAIAILMFFDRNATKANENNNS